jgi:hypothetical protein
MKIAFIFLIFSAFTTMASADEDAMLKYKDFTPQELAALSKEERYSYVPMAYSSAASAGLSEGSELLFSMQLNTLMYPGIANYKLAVKQYQKDLGDKDTGILTVSQISKLEKRSDFQKISRVFFPDQHSSYKAKTSASVHGTMMIHDENIAYPVNHTKITCYKSDNYCELKQLYLIFPKPDSWGANFHVMEDGTEFFDITRWGENTIDALPSDPSSSCRKTSLNLNFKTKEFYQITRNGDKDCEINGVRFPELEKPRIAQIVDGENIFNAEFSKLKKMAFGMLSVNFQDSITKLIESEQSKKPNN